MATLPTSSKSWILHCARFFSAVVSHFSHVSHSQWLSLIFVVCFSFFSREWKTASNSHLSRPKWSRSIAKWRLCANHYLSHRLQSNAFAQCKAFLYFYLSLVLFFSFCVFGALTSNWCKIIARIGDHLVRLCGFYRWLAWLIIRNF